MRMMGAKGPNHNTAIDNARRVFRKMQEFKADKREKQEHMRRQEMEVRREYEAFTPEERVMFFRMHYDEISDNYDWHMGVETNHYEAMGEVLWYAGQYLHAPLLDITAGTGELLLYVLELMEASRTLSSAGLNGRLMSRFPESDGGIVTANEISVRMLGKAREKLSWYDVEYTNHDAYDLPLERLYKTVLCSQTFHLINDEDKVRLVKAISRALESGGTAVIIEEDPFMISDSPYVGGMDMFLRAVACPIKHQGTLIAYFENDGFKYVEHSAHHAIDSKHSMWVHIFERT